MNTANTNRVLSEDFDMSRLIGKHITETPADLNWETAYPLVDKDTLIVTGIVDATDGGDWLTAGLDQNGKLVISEHYSDFAVTAD